MIINFEREPIFSLYFLGGVILKILNEKGSEILDILYEDLKKSIKRDIHIDFFYYTLDWLFISSLIKLDKGRVSI